jgi:hypothetical protein
LYRGGVLDAKREEREDLRLDWITQGVEKVFNLACLLSNGIQRARVAGHVSSAGASKSVLIRKVVTGGPTNLGHVANQSQNNGSSSRWVAANMRWQRAGGRCRSGVFSI